MWWLIADISYTEDDEDCAIDISDGDDDEELEGKIIFFLFKSEIRMTMC